MSVEEDDEPAERLGAALLGELELPPLAGLELLLEDFSSEVLLGVELEDEELGLLGVLLMELEDEGEVLLVPAEDEPDGEDGRVLEDEPVAERLVSEREAPALDPGPLSQP